MASLRRAPWPKAKPGLKRMDMSNDKVHKKKSVNKSTEQQNNGTREIPSRREGALG